jgi:hypothetical protein
MLLLFRSGLQGHDDLPVYALGQNTWTRRNIDLSLAEEVDFFKVRAFTYVNLSGPLKCRVIIRSDNLSGKNGPDTETGDSVNRTPCYPAYKAPTKLLIKVRLMKQAQRDFQFNEHMHGKD